MPENPTENGDGEVPNNPLDGKHADEIPQDPERPEGETPGGG